MADVHRARDRVLGREVALKLLRESLDALADRQRFAFEARLLAGLYHPHLVRLLDAGLAPGRQPWLVLELVDGPSLQELVATGPLDPTDVARLGAGAAWGLDHAHRQGVVHRDVKPGNILTTSAGEAKLADFGIALMVGEDAGLTRTGTTVGTAAYLAPEQVAGEEVTSAADVYSLGLVLLEALTGQRAYPGPALEAAMARLHHGPTVPAPLGAPWVGLLTAMTALSPGDRPRAATVAARLADVGSGSHRTAVMPVPAGPPVPPGAGGAAGDRRVGRGLLAAAAALAVVAVVAGVLALTGGGGAAGPPDVAPPAPSSRATSPSGAATTTPAPPTTTDSGNGNDNGNAGGKGKGEGEDKAKKEKP